MSPVLGGLSNGERFLSYVEEVLVLTPSQCGEAGAYLLFILPFSHDFNPIEQVLAKLKTCAITIRTNFA